jgi:magnesium chelatase family protein
VRSGIASAELVWPKRQRITVNLAPAELRKEGSGFDLPIALSILGATAQIPCEPLEDHAAVGELGRVVTARQRAQLSPPFPSEVMASAARLLPPRLLPACGARFRLTS